MSNIRLIGAAVVSAAIAAGCCDKENCGTTSTEPAAAATATANPEEVVAEVGGQKLLRGQLESEINEQMSQFANRIKPGQTAEVRRNLAARAINQFLVPAALTDKAQKLGYVLTDEDIAKREQEYLTAMVNSTTAPKTLEAYAATLPGGFEALKRNMLIDKMIKGEVLDKDTKDYETQAREIVAGIVEQNAKLFTDEEASVKIAELKKLLDETPAEGLADKFAELALANSACPSGKNGGDLGDFRRGAMVPEFDKVAFELAPGTVSAPVKTQFGYHLVLVKERKPAVEAKDGQPATPEMCRASHILLKTGEKEPVPALDTVMNILKANNNREKINNFALQALREANPTVIDEFKSLLPPMDIPAAKPEPAAEQETPAPAPVEIPAEK